MSTLEVPYPGKPAPRSRRHADHGRENNGADERCECQAGWPVRPPAPVTVGKPTVATDPTPPVVSKADPTAPAMLGFDLQPAVPAGADPLTAALFAWSLWVE